MANIILYSKKGCHLCEIARERLLEIKKEIPFTLSEVDIEEDEAIFKKYKYLIPVIELDGKVIFNYIVDEAILKNLIKSQQL
jgi:glutaredoxin